MGIHQEELTQRVIEETVSVLLQVVDLEGGLLNLCQALPIILQALDDPHGAGG